MATAGLRTQERKKAGIQEYRNAESQDGLAEHIREWARNNDWYRVDIKTNQLRLEQTFGQIIESIAKDMEYQNRSRMSRKIYDLYDLILAKCGKIDMVCRYGCRTEEELMDLELLRSRVVGLASELSEAIDVIKSKSAIIPDTKKPELATEVLEQKMTPANETAYQSYCLAEQRLGQCTDKQAFVWLTEHGPEDYDLPPFETWQKYVRSGRKFYNTNKNTPRAGRSIVASSAHVDPEMLSAISNRYVRKPVESEKAD